MHACPHKLLRLDRADNAEAQSANIAASLPRRALRVRHREGAVVSGAIRNKRAGHISRVRGTRQRPISSPANSTRDSVNVKPANSHAGSVESGCQSSLPLHADPSIRVDSFTPQLPPSRDHSPPTTIVQAQSFIEPLSIDPASIHSWTVMESLQCPTCYHKAPSHSRSTWKGVGRAACCQKLLNLRNPAPWEMPDAVRHDNEGSDPIGGMNDMKELGHGAFGSLAYSLRSRCIHPSANAC